FVEEIVDALVRSSIAGSLAVAAGVLRRSVGKRSAFDSVHDGWLYALRSEDDVLAGLAAEQAKLAEQVRTWQRPVAVSTTAPFLLCFRLEEPATSEGDEKIALPVGDWTLRYLLQG